MNTLSVLEEKEVTSRNPLFKCALILQLNSPMFKDGAILMKGYKMSTSERKRLTLIKDEHHEVYVQQQTDDQFALHQLASVVAIINNIYLMMI